MKTITIQSYNDGWNSRTYTVTEDGERYICPSYGEVKIPDNLKHKIKTH